MLPIIKINKTNLFHGNNMVYVNDFLYALLLINLIVEGIQTL